MLCGTKILDKLNFPLVHHMWGAKGHETLTVWRFFLS